MNNSINIQGLMELLRALEARSLDYNVEHRRVSPDCDGISVTVRLVNEIWQLGFFEWADLVKNEWIEVVKFARTGDAQNVTLEALLSELDKLGPSS